MYDLPTSVVRREGDIVFRTRDPGALEERMARLWRAESGAVRMGWYRNLRRLIGQADLIDLVPDELWDRLVSV